ncbi:class I SAM-dependent methyltransferase [Roseomonas sp. SSH11]|uniref:Class I SAM-dependent methyltransferase n=1 Tax=Pararoseomonas baculiformis TaxID=2820812 RepID=A0ABS4ALB6_9PROT|nr:class I SAM-dependent methyltransferase [Pararoseomonas baculiformis]MBP0446994.1 class I SAM-dependent methyltransferase [Pararoseomonas baculiformis]
MSGEQPPEQVALAYDRWAPVYDVIFGPVFRRGRRLATDAAERTGGRILEVGVGTGLSLAGYRASNTVIGVDISAPMLQKAHRRVERLRLRHVGGLSVMDAEQLAFPDSSFDVVVAQYVVTAVPNPERALGEFLRVVRPGGEIVIATRIGAETGLRSRIEKLMMPVSNRLGWRTEFPWARYARWAASAPGVTLVDRRPLPPLGHFALIRYRKDQDPARTITSQAKNRQRLPELEKDGR